MTPTTIGLMGFVILIALIFLRIPVGFVMAIVGFTCFGYLVSWNAALNLLARERNVDIKESY
jgi:membrane glycosyltransferase